MCGFNSIRARSCSFTPCALKHPCTWGCRTSRPVCRFLSISDNAKVTIDRERLAGSRCPTCGHDWREHIPPGQCSECLYEIETRRTGGAGTSVGRVSAAGAGIPLIGSAIAAPSGGCEIFQELVGFLIRFECSRVRHVGRGQHWLRILATCQFFGGAMRRAGWPGRRLSRVL